MVKIILITPKKILINLWQLVNIKYVAHTIGAAGVGAQVTNIYGDDF